MKPAKSVASTQYPRTVWREGERRLWNPIRRQALKNLPEERVRLRVLEYLLHGSWSKHRISTEEAIDLPGGEAALRTDLICYTPDFKPFLLVECKAENIRLSEKTAEQIARYNHKVGAPFLLMTNGRTDYWYRFKQEQNVVPVEAIPDPFPPPARPETDFGYWQQRGFAGENASPALRRWLTASLGQLMGQPDTSAIRYLAFDNSPTNIDLSHYYRIHAIETEGERLAAGLVSTPYGGSRLIGILNRDGHNEAVIEINLDLLFDGAAPNSSVYWSGGHETLDIRNRIATLTQSPFDAAAPLARLLRDRLA